MLALRLARDLSLHSRLQGSAPRWGLPPQAATLRILWPDGWHGPVERAATLLGLALLLTAVPSVRMAVHLLGGLYLVWIGIRLAPSPSTTSPSCSVATSSGRPESR